MTRAYCDAANSMKAPDGSAPCERRLAKMFGANLRRVRVERGFSRERLSRVAGAPSATLAEIEEGRVAPNIDTAWRIAVALDVPFAELAAGRPRRSSHSVVRAGKGNVVARSRGASTRALYALGHAAHAELYEISLAPGRTQKSEQRAAGTVENVVVHSGTLEILLPGEVVRLAVRDAIALHADQPHTFRNPGRAKVVAFVILSYPGGA